jgi:uncharacterized protein
MMKFLSAAWRHLLMANYVVSSELLEDLVPEGTRIDEFDGQVFVSLVAFLFDETRVLGIPVPFYRTFEEVNLRFYVSPMKDHSLRAVTFVKEIVPMRIIPLIANGLFHENYVAMPMDHGSDGRSYWYSWGADQQSRFSGTLSSELDLPATGSLSEFITEHYWGYARGPNKTLEYHVTHPRWRSCELSDYEIKVDFEATYGKRFACLNAIRPSNVLYAEGSPVTVSFPRRL